MEPSETQQLSSSYFHHPITSTNTTLNVTVPSPTNGLLPPNDGAHMVCAHSVPSVVTSPLEPVRRKRGRPRKYGTPEQALAAKKTASSSNNSSSARMKREQAASAAPSSYSASSRKSQLVALGNAGQGFTPHVINVAAGEDVAQKIMFFMQQSNREICILSATGSISNASLRQPATSGGSITYEGRFEIISLSGSYVHTDIGGKTGGLSICLASTDGQIIGGGVGGPLKAAGPVQVIIGTFFMDSKKDVSVSAKVDSSNAKLPSPVVASISSVGFLSGVDSIGRNPVRVADDHHNQAMGGNHFMIQPRGLHMTPPEWGGSPDGRGAMGYDLTGRSDCGPYQSLGNGECDHMAD